MRGNRRIRGGHKQPPRHAKMHNPLRERLLLLARFSANSSQLADNMFSGAVHGQQNPPLQAGSLRLGLRFEGLRVRPEPNLNDAVSVQALVDATGNRLHLRQFWHRSIVEDGAPRG